MVEVMVRFVGVVTHEGGGGSGGSEVKLVRRSEGKRRENRNRI